MTWQRVLHSILAAAIAFGVSGGTAGSAFAGEAGITTRVSVSSSGAQVSTDSSGGASVSADGRYVAFCTASALVSDDTNGVKDVYLRDRQTGTTTRVSVMSNGKQPSDGGGFSYTPSISADGRYIAFHSSAFF